MREVRRKTKPCATCTDAKPATSHLVHMAAFATEGPPIGLVQRKAVVGPVDDPFEREADAVATTVERGGAVPPIQRMPEGALTAQRAEVEAPVQRAAIEAPVQRSAIEAPVQRAAIEAPL
ncbi:hypothetical protein L6R52_40195, partial [Myxococcota bacterium]|nr:hypothetical protein [Myxococcota bacterium]